MIFLPVSANKKQGQQGCSHRACLSKLVNESVFSDQKYCKLTIYNYVICIVILCMKM
jgi:hypothetical protein